MKINKKYISGNNKLRKSISVGDFYNSVDTDLSDTISHLIKSKIFNNIVISIFDIVDFISVDGKDMFRIKERI
jgi:hypothetical protein